MDVVQETSWYLRPDGSLEMILLLAAFQEFFAEHSEAWLGALLPPGQLNRERLYQVAHRSAPWPRQVRRARRWGLRGHRGRASSCRR